MVLACSEEGAVIEVFSSQFLWCSTLTAVQTPALGAAVLPHSGTVEKEFLLYMASTVPLLHQVQTVQVLQVPSVLSGRNSSACVYRLGLSVEIITGKDQAE